MISRPKYGPDRTAEFLKQTELQCIVRAHECVANGILLAHSGKVITVFSAANYTERIQNCGAVLEIVPVTEATGDTVLQLTAKAIAPFVNIWNPLV